MANRLSFVFTEMLRTEGCDISQEDVCAHRSPARLLEGKCHPSCCISGCRSLNAQTWSLCYMSADVKSRRWRQMFLHTPHQKEKRNHTIFCSFYILVTNKIMSFNLGDSIKEDVSNPLSHRPASFPVMPRVEWCLHGVLFTFVMKDKVIPSCIPDALQAPGL